MKTKLPEVTTPCPDPSAAEENSTTEIRQDPADVTGAPDTTDVPLLTHNPQRMRTRAVRLDDYVRG